MNNLSKNLRTHIVTIQITKDQIKEIYITKKQYNKMTNDLVQLSATETYSIHDADTKKLLFNGQKRFILSYNEINRESKKYYTICNFGKKHQINFGKYECNCEKEIGINGFDVMPALQVLGYSIMYNTQITEEMRIKLKQAVETDPDFKKKIKEKFIEMQKK